MKRPDKALLRKIGSALCIHSIYLQIHFAACAPAVTCWRTERSTRFLYEAGKHFEEKQNEWEDKMMSSSVLGCSAGERQLELERHVALREKERQTRTLETPFNAPGDRNNGELPVHGASNRDPPGRRPFDRGQRGGVMGGNDGRLERR